MTKIYKIKKDKLIGRFYGKNPSQAAQKALTSIIKKSNHNTALFTIVENKTKKEHTYFGKRVKLNTPVSINVKGKTIVFRYRNLIKKIN